MTPQWRDNTADDVISADSGADDARLLADGGKPQKVFWRYEEFTGGHLPASGCKHLADSTLLEHVR